MVYSNPKNMACTGVGWAYRQYRSIMISNQTSHYIGPLSIILNVYLRENSIVYHKMKALTAVFVDNIVFENSHWLLLVTMEYLLVTRCIM